MIVYCEPIDPTGPNVRMNRQKPFKHFNPQPDNTLRVRKREGGRGDPRVGGREEYQCDRETSFSCLPYLPQPGLEPTT